MKDIRYLSAPARWRSTAARSLLFLAVLAAAAIPAPAAPTVRIWSGASLTSGNWTSAANWDNGAPVAGDILNFVSDGARKSSNTNNFPAGTAFSTINLFGTGYRLRGNSVTISNYVGQGSPTGTNTIDLDLIAAGPGVGLTLRSVTATDRLTLNGDINLNARTLSTEGPGDFIIGGVISGTGGIFKDNSGDLSLSGAGANTFTGTTFVNAGILRLNRYFLLGGSAGLDIIVLPGTVAIPGDLVIGTGPGGLTADLVVLERDNQIANTSDVTVNGSGSLELSDENDTIGTLTLTAGFVTTGTGTLTLGGPVTVNAGNEDAVITGRLNLGTGAARIFNVLQGAQLTVSAQIDGDAGISLVKSNRGDLLLTASNLFNGPVEIVGGTLAINHAYALGTTNGATRPILGRLAVNSGLGVNEPLEAPGPSGTLEVTSGSSSWLGPVVLNDALNLYVPTNSFLTLVGQLSGPAGWFKYGEGTLQFKTPYTNTYSGTGILHEGDIILDGVFNHPVISGPLIIGSSNNPAGSERVSYIKHQQIADAVPITINRSGLLALQGFDDTVGPLTFHGGAVETGSGTLTLNGDILAKATNQTASIAGNLALGGVTRTIYTLGTASTPDLLISAVISDGGAAAGFHKIGEGALLLSGANTFSGPVSVTDGLLRLTHAQALGSPVAGTTVSGIDGPSLLLEGPITVAAEPLILNSTGPGAPPVLENRFGTNRWDGPVTLLAPESVIHVPSIPRPLFMGGAISGPGGLTKTGTGQLTLDGNTTNSFNGLTYVADGELILDKPGGNEAIHGDLTIGDGLGGANADRVRVRGGGDEIGNGSRVILDSSGQLILQGVLDLVGSLEGAGNVSLPNGPGTAGLIVGRNDLSTTFSGIISGNGNFQKTGLGTLILTATQAYTGPSQVDEGVLQVDGSIASSSWVLITQDFGIPGRAGTLGGGGTVPRLISWAGGTVSPGASPGRLVAQGPVQLSNSVFRVELNGLTPGTQHDQLRALAEVDLGNSSLQVAAGFPPAMGDSFVILDKVSPGPVSGGFIGLAEGVIMGSGANKYRITYQGGDGNDVVLTRVDVPPSTITSITPVTAERMQILGQGLPFVTYVLEAAPHLNPPIPWIPIATNHANALGLYEFIDAYTDQGVPLHFMRFYRVMSP